MKSKAKTLWTCVNRFKRVTGSTGTVPPGNYVKVVEDM